MGGIVSTPLATAILNGCKIETGPKWLPQFLTEKQAELVSIVAETIIPATTTPGAIEARVPQFIDLMLKDVYPQEYKDKFLQGLVELDAKAENDYGETFKELNPDQCLELLNRLNKEAINNPSSEDDTPFILMAKEMVLLGFFTSEIGSTQVLQYNLNPGEYKGCLPLEEIGKAWVNA